ncbi:phospholipid carrier-dependent glycosyltransferase [Candidatus Woesebacteria bacterium]|nr:phospholipid carrier-dependent glycosyltransferase [Candidatus Woesebacteria bacterium]
MHELLYRYRAVALLLILSFAFFTRMYRLHLPEKYMFDEVYHAVTAKLIAENDPRAYEWWNPPPEENTAVDWLHPPLAKYTQALSMLAFGENSFGWRFSSVVFGVLVILMVYHLAYALFDNHSIALTSALIASLDGLLLVQSRIAMNDIHVTFFILLALHSYLAYRKSHQTSDLILTAIIAGLAMASKWSGLFVLACILLFEAVHFLSGFFYLLAAKRVRIESILSKVATFAATRIVVLILIPLAVYVAGYTHMFLQGKGWAHFKELHNQIWWYQTTLKATHPYQSRPLEWFLDLKPVWVHVEYFPSIHMRADIYSFGNPIIFWVGAFFVIVSLASCLLSYRKFIAHVAKKAPITEKIASFLGDISNNSLIFLLTAYFMVWLPWQLSPRIMFFYHYTPAVPLMSIIIAYWLERFWSQKKIIPLLVIGSMVLVFIVWYPHWTGIPVSDSFANSVYFALPSWK